MDCVVICGGAMEADQAEHDKVTQGFPGKSMADSAFSGKFFGCENHISAPSQDYGNTSIDEFDGKRQICP